MNSDLILSGIRQALTFLGGIFIAKGVINADTLAQIVTQISTIAGSIAVLVSLYGSWKTHKE